MERKPTPFRGSSPAFGSRGTAVTQEKRTRGFLVVAVHRIAVAVAVFGTQTQRGHAAELEIEPGPIGFFIGLDTFHVFVAEPCEQRETGARREQVGSAGRNEIDVAPITSSQFLFLA